MELQKDPVYKAILTTKEYYPGIWENTLERRIAGYREGIPVFYGVSTVDNLMTALLSAKWIPYIHPNIPEGCRAFKTTDLCGGLGLVDLRTLDPYREVLFDEERGTGHLYVVVCKAPVTTAYYATIILQHTESAHGKIEVVADVFPGDPIKPTRIPNSDSHSSLTGGVTTLEMARSIAAARDVDLVYGKVVSERYMVEGIAFDVPGTFEEETDEERYDRMDWIKSEEMDGGRWM